LGLVGNDKHKDIFSRLCNNTNVKFHELVTKFPTITKQRFIENTYKQQLLRVDYEEYFSLSEDEIFSIIEIVKSNNYEYIVISDYDK
jgi:bifunctional ADP-heptose synthase (sugar kinase/adenylyltransferase)